MLRVNENRKKRKKQSEENWKKTQNTFSCETGWLENVLQLVKKKKLKFLNTLMKKNWANKAKTEKMQHHHQRQQQK